MSGNFLRKLPLFESLPPEDLDRLCEMAEELVFQRGEVMMEEGDPGDALYVIREGEFEVLKRSGGQQVVIAVRGEGEVMGEIALLVDSPRTATVRALTTSRVLKITRDMFLLLLRNSPSAAISILRTITSRLRNTESMLRQNEKMAALGTLSAGLAHELNNPSAAVQRSAAQLRATLEAWQRETLDLSRLTLSAEQLSRVQTLREDMIRRALEPVNLDPLARSDRESDLQDWLENHGVDRAWELAPVLVTYGWSVSELDALYQGLREEQSLTILSWLATGYSVYALLDEVGQSSDRISEIVKAVKSYSYLDQAPVQQVDLYQSLENTLIILKHKLKGGINVKKEFAPDLPQIEAYGSELNQVWTNIIDNAIDAMKGQGELTIRTYRKGNDVVVEIQDNGPGIPEEIQPRIFEPFFTTKPPGVGTGLGLHISYNIIQKHHGQINVYSRPGQTCFRVVLPLQLRRSEPMPEDQIADILKNSHTIASVGLSADPAKISNQIGLYLKEHGYTVIPVNPTVTEVLGEKSYPDLLSVPDKIDVVQVFRPSDDVPPVVDQAIKVGAKVVWMQQGIVNEDAANRARAAGLQVVMDRCMRVEHRRIVGAAKPPA